MAWKSARAPFSFVLLFSVVLPLAAQSHDSHSQLDQMGQYVEQVSELSARARANVYFANPQSIFRGVQVNFVNVGAGNLTFLRRDLVTAGRIPLVFARVYDSSGQGSTDFGPGWTLSAAEFITIEDGKAHLFSENGSSIDFVKSGTGFQLAKDYPSDYVALGFVDAKTLEATMRTGFIKQFQRIGDAFRLVQVTDRNGNPVRLSYSNGLLQKIENANHSIIIFRNAKGRIVSVQDDQQRHVQFSYDAQGRLSEVDDLGGKSWTYSYTREGRLRNARDPLQRLNFSAFFDESGRVRRLQVPSGTIQFNYDPATRSTTVLDRKDLVSRFFQSEDGITTRVVNPLGEETAIGLDEARNVISLSRDGSVIERMDYDKEHRIIARHSLTESEPVDRTYSYDPATGLLAGIHSSKGDEESFAYDEKGNLISAMLPDGVHKYGFSPGGDLASLSVGKRSVAFSSDSDGLISSVRERKSGATTLRYRPGGELKQAIFPGGVRVDYKYEPSGLRASLTVEGRSRSEYSYDPAGNLTGSAVFDGQGTQVNGQKLDMNESYQLTRWTVFDGTVTKFEYDPNGNLTVIKKGKSVTRFEYDALNRLTAVIAPDGQRFTYSYKPGERSLIEQHLHGAVLVEDARDTGLTFAGPRQISATRPLVAVFGTVRFSETLGLFQLSNADGSEIIRPQENVEASLKKQFLFASTVSQRTLRSGFNIPFNTLFMPAEYLTINCCPECYDLGGEWYCPPCFLPPPPPVPTYFEPTGADPLISPTFCPVGTLGSGFRVHYQVLDQDGFPLAVGGMTPLESVTSSAGENIVQQPFSTPVSTNPDGTFDDFPLGTCFGPPIPQTNVCISVIQTFNIIFTDGLIYPISTTSSSRQCAQGISLDVTGNPIGENGSFSIGTVN
jgi:YD repeat-containing protein